MQKLTAYWYLMRFHAPIGILLLWLPTAWSLWLAGDLHPSFRLVIYFFVGVVCMRAAGCVVNDIADRNIDRHVSRTRLRPLTAGQVSLQEALILLLILLFCALLILIQLPSKCFYYALFSVLITGLYPFCKRFFQAPQLILGLAFSMGIPMAYVASNATFTLDTAILLSINVLWVVAYDTIYAMMDLEDDKRIGIQSTAMLFGDYERWVVLFLQILMHSLWLWLALEHHYAWLFYGCWGMAACNLIYQHYLLRKQQPKAYFKAFLTNAWYGAWMWLGLMLGARMT